MFQQLSDSLTPASNDDGSFFHRRGHRAFPSNILEAASHTAGPICLSYVAQGVFLISGQLTSDRHRRGIRAA